MKPNPDFERLIAAAEFKLVGGSETGVIEGYANVFGNLDLNGDIMEPGAFRKTIQERVSKGLVPLLDSHIWDIAHTIGAVFDANEDAKGLRFKARMSGAPSAQDARLKMLEGTISHLSIGFVPTREDWKSEELGGGKRKSVRHLQEVKLYEISALPIAANELATLISVKSVMPFQDLPLAGRDQKWDVAAAGARLVEWASPGGALNPSRMRRASIWHDRDRAGEAAAYKLAIADLVGDELCAVPAAIIAAAGTIEQAGIPQTDAAGVREHMTRYFEKMRAEFGDDSIRAPWELKAPLLDAIDLKAYSSKELAAATRRLLAAITSTSDRELLIAEMTAGPAAKPPTVDDASGNESVALRTRALEVSLKLGRRRVEIGNRTILLQRG